MPATTLMPLISSFPPGSARAHAESIANADARSIALAELAYFQGRAEDALALAAPYFESPDIMYCLSRTWQESLYLLTPM